MAYIDHNYVPPFLTAEEAAELCARYNAEALARRARILTDAEPVSAEEADARACEAIFRSDVGPVGDAIFLALDAPVGS